MRPRGVDSGKELCVVKAQLRAWHEQMLMLTPSSGGILRVRAHPMADVTTHAWFA
jgi:hypothetical protein